MSGIQKISTIILYVIAGISVILTLLYYLGGIVPETIDTNFEEFKFTGEFMVWGLILVIITAVLTLIFSFANIFTNKAAIKGFLISLVTGLILLGIAYALSKSDMIHILPSEIQDKTTTGQLKWAGTGLIATYILFVVAIIGMLVSEIVKAFK